MRWTVIAVILSSAAWAGPAQVDAGAGEEKAELRTAQEVIARNLEAVGGADRIAAVTAMALTGASGSALLPPSERVTVYVARPNKLKQVGDYRVVLCTGGECVSNNGDATRVLDGGVRERLEYRLGFYHSCFSLLAWKDLHDAAELVGVKDYGGTRQYEIRLPAAENGRDVIAYVDSESLLVDRLVFEVGMEGIGTLRVVNQLRDWTTVGGIKMPKRLVFDTIGWETTPTHFVIDEIEIDPELEPGLFDSAVVDFGTVTAEAGVVHGQVFGEMDGSILVNIREDDLAAAGIEVKSWLDLEVGGATRLKVRYLSNIQRSAADIKPGEIYLTTYPISLYPRMMLLGWEMDVGERIPCSKGDVVVVTLRGAREPQVQEESES
jgi:hypothetical protein